jgi:hypothetical protein
MPAAPVIEKIAVDVFNTLKGITVVDGFPSTCSRSDESAATRTIRRTGCA